MIIIINFEAGMPCGSVCRFFQRDNMLTNVKD